MPKISIITPVYNVQKYLARCIDSILVQTFTDFELILVDDGSNDQSGEMCDAYAARDGRIVVLHQQNAGQAVARNRALDIAKGDYIAFVDSDDRVHPRYLEVLYSNAISANVDISICSHTKESEGEILPDEQVTDKKTAWSGKEFLRHSMFDSVGKHWLLWDKLYEKSCFDGVRLPEGRIFEDNATVYKLLYDAKRVVDCDCKLYYYFQRSDSTVNRTFNLKKLDYLTVCEEMIGFFDKRGEAEMKWHMEKSYFYEMLDLYPAVCALPAPKEAKDLKRKIFAMKSVLEKREEFSPKTQPRFYDVMYPKRMKLYWAFMALKKKISG